MRLAAGSTGRVSSKYRQDYRHASINRAYVIGVVMGVQLHRETLYGVRNGKTEPRKDLFEHSDLVQIVPLEFVRETVEHLKRRGTETLTADKTQT